MYLAIGSNYFTAQSGPLVLMHFALLVRWQTWHTPTFLLPDYRQVKKVTFSPNINPFMLNELLYLNSLDQSISSLRGVWSFFIITMFYGNTCN